MSGKIDDFDFPSLPQPLIDFKDQVRLVLNTGNMQMATGTVVPTYNGNQGQVYFRINSTSVAMYVCYTANTWILLTSV